MIFLKTCNIDCKYELKVKVCIINLYYFFKVPGVPTKSFDVETCNIDTILTGKGGFLLLVHFFSMKEWGRVNQDLPNLSHNHTTEAVPSVKHRQQKILQKIKG